MTEMDDIKKKIEELKKEAEQIRYDRNRQMQMMCNERIKQNLVQPKKRWNSNNVFFIYYVLLVGSLILYIILEITKIFSTWINLFWYFWLLMCLMVCNFVVLHLVHKHNKSLK
jgi:cation transport ATPase